MPYLSRTSSPGRPPVLKPIGFLACALVAASLSARPGAAGPGAARGEPARAAASSAPARTAPVAVPEPHLAAPVITSILPDTLRPGEDATITGSGFRTGLTNNSVLVDGVPVRVKSATNTQLLVELPVRGFECREARPVPVAVRTSGSTTSMPHPLRAAEFVELQAGDVVTPDEFGQSHCVELPQDGGRYWVGVVNVEDDGPPRGFMLQGNEGTITGPPILPPASGSGLVRRATPERFAAAAPAAADSVRVASEAHVELLARERDRVLARRTDGRRPPRPLAGQPLAPRPLPSVGDVDTMRIWEKWGDCSTYQELEARVVYVGDHAIILEDRAAPLAGSMNADYQLLGAEFDSVMWDIVIENFGNPLLWDSGLDDDNRVRMLFTPQVTELDSTTFAYVTSCDFYKRQGDNASSNEGEVFYSKVPRTQADRTAWLRTARPTLIHETKHIASIAERLYGGGDLEHAWLEEGTAMVAEELYGRRKAGTAGERNVGFDRGLGCVYSGEAQCSDVPRALALAWDQMYDYLYSPETRSPIEPGLTSYGTGWSLARWAADLSPLSEPEFFTKLTRNVQGYGAGNLASHAGRPFSELVLDWHLATVFDDLGYPPSQPQHEIRRWNTRDVYSGMHKADGQYFDREFPLVPHEQSFGSFVLRVTNLPSASASYAEIAGAQWATQLVGLRNADGSARRDNSVRMFIIRMD